MVGLWLSEVVCGWFVRWFVKRRLCGVLKGMNRSKLKKNS